MSTFSFSRPVFLRMATSGGQQGRRGNGGSEKSLQDTNHTNMHPGYACLHLELCGLQAWEGVLVGRRAVNIWCMQFQAGRGKAGQPRSEVEDLHLLTRSRRLTNVCFSDVSFATYVPVPQSRLSAFSAISAISKLISRQMASTTTPLSGSNDASKMIKCAH